MAKTKKELLAELADAGITAPDGATNAELQALLDAGPESSPPDPAAEQPEQQPDTGARKTFGGRVRRVQEPKWATRRR